MAGYSQLSGRAGRVISDQDERRLITMGATADVSQVVEIRQKIFSAAGAKHVILVLSIGDSGVLIRARSRVLLHGQRPNRGIGPNDRRSRNSRIDRLKSRNRDERGDMDVAERRRDSRFPGNGLDRAVRPTVWDRNGLAPRSEDTIGYLRRNRQDLWGRSP